MGKIFMIGLWAFSGIFLVKSYFEGLSNQMVAEWEYFSTKAMQDTALGEPWAGFKDMSDLGMWYQISAVVVLVIYIMYTIKFWGLKMPSPRSNEEVEEDE